MFALPFALAALAAAVDPLAAADARVGSIGWRLQTANVALCDRREPVTGLSLQMLEQYPPADRAAVAARSGLGDAPAISAVVPGSSADRAGLKAGDAIDAIAGVATPRSRGGKARHDGIAAVQTALEAALAHPPAVLAVSGRRVILSGDSGCASRIELVPRMGDNARADGRYVQIGGGLYDLAEGDDELAFAIAHELAHNILGHRDRLDEAKVSRGLFAGLGRGGALLRRSEYDADRLALWLAARAGYDPHAALPFLARLGRKTGQGIFADGTHPGWKARIAAARAALSLLDAQRAANKALVPPAQ